MMKKHTYQEVSQVLEYNPSTGRFHRKINTSANGRVGLVKGYINNAGYRKTSVLDYQYYDHHLAWLLHYKEWPQKQIDHINNNKSDNRIKNLRLATVSQNAMNRSFQKNNISKEKCIHWKREKKKYLVRIGVNRKYLQFGYFKTIEEAIVARDRAIKKLHGEFAKV
jgi:hypothetical protein